MRRTPEGYRGYVSLAASDDGRSRVACGADGATPTGALERAAAMAAEAAQNLAVREDAIEAAEDLDAVCGFVPPAQAAAAASKALNMVKKLFRAIRARRKRRRAAAARRRAEQAAQPAPPPAQEPETVEPGEDAPW